ncbi:MAG: ABC transporter ATP-binding protein [Acidobacteria bacterium]|nr:ABC transporter ATP-binding protein [Acidobacteriota bacterium]MCZ6649669.1 ABC transporter ATP-binding protein [Acidobacteriota bacterium]
MIRSSDEPVLTARGLCKTFRGHLSVGRTQVLRGLDLTVYPGEIYGFIGANGAGKTTTIKILAGLIHPNAGEFRLLGYDGADPRSRRGLGFLPEHPNFPGYLSGREFLDFQARLVGLDRGRRRRDVGRLLDEVGMAGRADTPLRKCSKGMLQRLGIAQALLGDPVLLILDEPMSGLDPAGRRDLRDLILAQPARGTTVFFSSHILSDAEVLCDRVGILREGRLALEGSLDTILGPGAAAWDVTATRASGLNAGSGTTAISRQDDRVLFRVEGEAALADLLDRLRAAGAGLHSVTPRRLTLEERFLDLEEQGTRARHEERAP